MIRKYRRKFDGGKKTEIRFLPGKGHLFTTPLFFDCVLMQQN